MAQPTGRRPLWRRGLVATAAAALAAPLVDACGAGAGGGVTISVYYPPEQHFQNVIDQCNQQANGAYHIELLTAPRAAHHRIHVTCSRPPPPMTRIFI